MKKAEVAKMINRSSESGEEGDQLYRLLGSVHNISGEKYKPESRLSEDLGLDSLDTIKLAVEIENEYNIDTDQIPISRDTTVGELKKYISSPQKTSKKLPFYNFPYWFAVTVIRTIFQYIIYPFIRILIKLKPYGVENLKQAKEPVVFAANHTSHLDTLVILYCLPLALRRKATVLMSIEHHFTHFFYRQGCWARRFIEAAGFYLLVNLAMNTTPLSRTFGFKQSMENIGRLLDRGWSIIIFPEGRVTPDGKIRSFEPGIGMISKDMEATVVPVKIKGLYGLLKNGLLPLGHMPRRPRVSVIFGKPEGYF
ncbi:MAG: 1-acyl-sn-glycerol-3-phosphate acyltransferase [Actinomycetota bacterium]|nr:1-acyl-sn-glycerol-3-phosphate acyltransferase [Actinomycetota bacterium]